MNLATTMGMELTYLPGAVQIALDRGADFEPENAPDSSFCESFCTLMQHLIKAKKIPTYGYPSTDPGCVEIRTKPYQKLTSLLNIARRLRREAEALGMVTHADYTNGGGAHIHTGIIGEDAPARALYVKRMALFVAMNPWLSWAELNVNDDVNAVPVTRDILFDVRGAEYSVARTREWVRVAANRLDSSLEHYHRSSLFGSSYHADVVNEYREDLMKCRIKYAKALKVEGNGTTQIEVSDITYIGNKEHMFRKTNYGTTGTIEFRFFEMGNEAKLERNIKLADAICRYVAEWGITKFNPNDVMSTEQMRSVSYRAARKGWLSMLVQLGLDPAEYTAETAQIACRWRYSRAWKVNPTAVGLRVRRADQDDPTATLAALVRRARTRHGRRATRCGRFTPQLDTRL